MAKFNFSGSTISGNHHVFGDSNRIVNNFSGSDKWLEASVLTGEDYYSFCVAIRDQERISLGDYLSDLYGKYSDRNRFFIQILYKDITKVLEGIPQQQDIDLVIQNGDFAVAYGDVRLSGAPTNFHYALVWLYIKLTEKFAGQDAFQLQKHLNHFENEFLLEETRSRAYVDRLLALGQTLKTGKQVDLEEKSAWDDLLEMVDISIPFGVVNLKVNEVIKKFFRP